MAMEVLEAAKVEAGRHEAAMEAEAEARAEAVASATQAMLEAPTADMAEHAAAVRDELALMPSPSRSSSKALPAQPEETPLEAPSAPVPEEDCVVPQPKPETGPLQEAEAGLVASERADGHCERAAAPVAEPPKPACVEKLPVLSPEEQAKVMRSKRPAPKGKAKAKAKSKAKGKKTKKKEPEDIMMGSGGESGPDDDDDDEHDDPAASSGDRVTIKDLTEEGESKQQAKPKGKAKAKASPQAKARGKAKASPKEKASRAKAKASPKAKARGKAKASPKAKARGKAKASCKAKATVKGAEATKHLQEDAENATASSKDKDTGTRRKRARASTEAATADQIAERKATNNRRSKAYYHAKREALKEGLTEEEAKAKGQEAPQLESPCSCALMTYGHMELNFPCNMILHIVGLAQTHPAIRPTSPPCDREEHEPAVSSRMVIGRLYYLSLRTHGCSIHTSLCELGLGL